MAKIGKSMLPVIVAAVLSAIASYVIITGTLLHYTGLPVGPEVLRVVRWEPLAIGCALQAVTTAAFYTVALKLRR